MKRHQTHTVRLRSAPQRRRHQQQADRKLGVMIDPREIFTEQLNVDQKNLCRVRHCKRSMELIQDVSWLIIPQFTKGQNYSNVYVEDDMTAHKSIKVSHSIGHNPCPAVPTSSVPPLISASGLQHLLRETSDSWAAKSYVTEDFYSKQN